MTFLNENEIYCGKAEELLPKIEPRSVAVSFWSPPYFLGKEYERSETFESWQAMLRNVIGCHASVLKPGGFMVINIADILAFRDEKMPRIQAMNISNHRSGVTREMVLNAKTKFPSYSRYQLAELLGCSEQTIERRLKGNNIRGGKYDVQTRVKLVGGGLEEYAYEAGLYLYDKRIWRKDPAWENCKWTTCTLKAVSETEDIYIYWNPGEYAVDRERLTSEEWKKWGLRQVWEIPSVRKNDVHAAMFPEELASRVIRLFSSKGDLVLDPFVGSGTTAIAAIRAERRFIGVDKEPEYVEIARRNVNAALCQTSLIL